MPKKKSTKLLNKIDLKSFHSKVDELALRTYHVPDLVESKYPEDRTTDVFTFYEEATLANDFAFIASRGLEPGSVTAVAIEAKNDQPGIVVRLAANKGVQEDVERFMKDILSLLGN